MATDIAQILSKAQDTIDKAIETVSATTETQRVLNLNIATTDTKIGVHNVNEKAHEDIRVALADLPAMITDPMISGPSAVETDEDSTWVLSAASMMPTVSILSFSITDSKGNKYSVAADADGRANFTHAFSGNNGDTIKLLVRALGSLKFASKDVEFQLTLTKHSPPDISGLQHTIPSRVSYGKSYPFKVSGITDIDGDLTSVDLLYDDTKLTLSQSTNITQGLEYQITVPANVKGPGTTNITIRATDARGLTNSHVVTLTLNSDPVLSALAHTIPNVILKDSSVTCRVSGVADPEGDPVSFAISSSNPGISFSKLSGIGLNEDFVITALNTATETACVFTLTFSDGYGGSASTTVISKINFPPDVTNMSITQPEKYIPGQPAKMSFTGAVDSEGAATTYTIVNVHPELTFSKTSGIVDNEQVDVSLSVSAQRGALLPVAVRATDKYGSYTVVNVTIAVNTPPSVAGIVTDIPARCIPGKTYTWYVSGLTDADGQALTYSVSTNNSNVELTDATNRTSGQSFQCTIPTEDKLPRGDSFLLTISVSDGYETTDKIYTITQNRQIDMTNFTHNLPQRFIPGSTVPFTMYGAADPDGEPLVYSIAGYDSTVCTFSKYTHIGENESVNLIVRSDAVRGTNTGVVLRVTDSAGEFMERTLNCKINSLPAATNLAVSLTGLLQPNHTYSGISVAGITDEESGDAIRINVTATNGVTILNGTNIQQGEAFSVLTPPVSTLGRGGSFMLMFAISDGYETVNTTKTFKVNTLPDVQNLTLSLPAKLKPNTEYSGVSFTGATDADAQELHYTFTASNGVAISNGDNLTGGTFTVTTPAEGTLARGSSFTITATVSDGIETITKDFPCSIRQLPDISELTDNIPALSVPGATVQNLSVSGAISHDSLPLLYSIGSSNTDVFFTGALAIPAGTAFSMTAPTADKLARGSSFPVMISVSDGVEVATVTRTVTQNILPETTGLNATLAASMFGGTENAIPLVITGGSDTENSNFKYSIENVVGSLTFSKTAGITANETVTVSSPKVLTSTACSFDIYVTDTAGEKSVAFFHVATSVEPIVVTAAPTITYPVNGDSYVPNTGFTITFTEYASTIWTGDGAYPNNV